jgi:hypothetical protein
MPTTSGDNEASSGKIHFEAEGKKKADAECHPLFYSLEVRRLLEH